MAEQSYLPPARPLPEPNPQTKRTHRREVFWQITAPFIFGVLLLLGLAFGLAFNQVGEVAGWAEISTMFLLLPVIVFSLIPFALIVALAYGLIRLIPILPSYTRLVQDAFKRVELRVKQGADLAAEPILRTSSFSAMLRRIFQRSND